MSEHTPPRPEQYADAARRYRIDSRIATGGMGEVWRGTDTALDREVAVKLLKSEYADDPTFRSRFESEARHAAALHHPNVCAVYDVGESPATDGSGVPRPFLVMELVDGQPLSALLRGGRKLDASVMRDLLAQAADAIGAAHAAGIVHRDVKPANLMVTPDRRIKITDFGIARASDNLGLTGTGQVMGTPQYLSPEQARGNPATPASDVYSLGVVAWECLAGHRPFEKGTPVATALAHLNDPVPPLPDFVPRDLATVVERAMAKDPRERYRDGDELAAALRDPATAATQVVSVPPIVVPVPSALEATSVLGAVPPPRTPPEPIRPLAAPPDPREERADRGGVHPGWIAVGLLALALIGLLLYLQLRGDGGAPDAPTPSPSSSAPRPKPSPSKKESPTQEPTPAAIELNESDYVGRPVDDVLSELRDLGLNPDPQVVDNPGNEQPDDVSGLSPTQGLSEGDTVQVSYWDARPEPDPTPTQDSQTPTPSPTPKPTPKPTPTPLPIPTPTPSGQTTQSTQTQSPSPSTTPAAVGAAPASTTTATAGAAPVSSRRESGRQAR